MDREPRIEVGETVIGLEKGDITDCKVDAVVNPANTDLKLGAGVAGAIARRGGSTIQKECDDFAPIELGDAVRTRGGLMPAKFVIHAAVMGQDRKTDTDVISQATKSALVKAEEVGLKRVAFPALGTGVGEIPYADAAKAMLDATLEYLGNRDTVRILEVTYVLNDDEAYRAYKEALSNHQ
ncbi:MAG: Appr-1-p processing protein [bacterium]|nr:Appr-1-p processing protein [bacterium]